MVSTKATTATAVRLLYIIDVAAFFLGENYEIEFVGSMKAAQEIAADEPTRYEIYTSRKDYNNALRYYRSIL